MIPPDQKQWISCAAPKECEDLILDINNKSHIKKAIFVYDINKNFLAKYEGVAGSASRALNISHLTIKKNAMVGGTYNGYIFSYERLN